MVMNYVSFFKYYRLQSHKSQVTSYEIAVWVTVTVREMMESQYIWCQPVYSVYASMQKSILTTRSPRWYESWHDTQTMNHVTQI